LSIDAVKIGKDKNTVMCLLSHPDAGYRGGSPRKENMTKITPEICRAWLKKQNPAIAGLCWLLLR
jgi:hypothetical protein